MFDRLRKTAKLTAVYGLGNISAKLAGLILLPLYTNYLSASEYGTFAILEVTMNVLSLLMGINLSTAMLRWCASEENDTKKKSIIFTTFAGSTVATISLMILLIPFDTQFSLMIFSSLRYSNYFTVLFFSSALTVLNLLPLALIRLEEKAVFYVVVNLSKFFLILISNIFFLAYMNLGVLGILYGQLVGQIFLMIVTIPLVLKNIVFAFNFKIFLEMIKYGFPLIFSSLSAMILSMGDRYILKYYLSLSEVGIYSLGYKIAGFINVFIINSFQLGFLPIAFKVADEQNPGRFFSKVQTYFALFLTLAVVGISIFGIEIVQLFSMNDEYLDAYKVIPFIAYAFLLKGLGYNFGLGFHFIKKTKYNAYIVVIGAVVSIGLNFLLIPLIGIYGAAISMICSFLVMNVLSYQIANKLYFIPYEINKLLFLTVSSLIIIFISFNLNALPLFVRIFIKLLFLIAFPFILYFFNFYEKAEIRKMSGAWHKWKHPSRWKENLRKIKL